MEGTRTYEMQSILAPLITGLEITHGNIIEKTYIAIGIYNLYTIYLSLSTIL
jgi:hypothetical protein